MRKDTFLSTTQRKPLKPLHRYVRPVLALVLTATIAGPTYAAPDELIQLTPEEKATFWNSPYFPAAISFVAPGSGQLLQSDVFTKEPDWFGFGRGVLYLGLAGLAGWQLFNSINNQDNVATGLWSGVLVGVNILAPLDAFMTASAKQSMALRHKQETQLTAIYSNAALLAEKKDFDQAIAQLKVIPDSFPQSAVNQQLIKQWQAAKEQQKKVPQESNSLLQKPEPVKQVTVTVEKKVLKTDSSPANFGALVNKTQQHLNSWQAKLAEQQAQTHYEQAVNLIKVRRLRDALALLEKIPVSSPYYIAAQEKIAALPKWVRNKK